MNKTKRYILLCTYVLISFVLYMFFVADNLVPRHDESFTILDTLPFVFMAGIFGIHHFFSYKYLLSNYRVVSFQLFCSIVDLISLFHYSSLHYFRFKEWMLIWIVGLRIISLLLRINN